MEKEIKLSDIISNIAILLICILLMVLIFTSHNTRKEQINNFCKSYGFNKVTDYKQKALDIYCDYDIECDNGIIFKCVSVERRCLEYDKWDECIKYETYLTN